MHEGTIEVGRRLQSFFVPNSPKFKSAFILVKME